MVEAVSKNKIPLVGELPEPDKRVFDNSVKERPARKRKTLEVRFGDLTPKNFE